MPALSIALFFAAFLAPGAGSDPRPPVILTPSEPQAEDPASPDESAELAPAGDAASSPVAPGAPFPPMRLTIVSPGSFASGSLDLAAHLGKQPVVLVYFKIGNALSEEIYLEVEDFVERELAGKVALYPVTALGRELELTELHERMRLLGLRRPVILDEEKQLRIALKVRFVPNIALVNAQGELSFSDARSLLHPVRGELTARDAFVMASRGERPPARVLWRHYPANDLKSRPFERLALPELGTGATLRIADFVEPGKLAAILYWSPSCRYSKSVMPGVVAAQRTFGGKQLNLLSVVRDGDDEEVRRFADEQGMSFPIARNRDKRFSTKYRVVSTPTLITIGPDGRIDDVYTSSNINFFAVLRARIEALILSPSAPPKAPASSG